MGRAPCCEKDSVKRGPWTPEEDAKLLACVAQHGTGNWRTLPRKAGLQRCGKSCRLRWINYLRPDLKHTRFTEQEEQLIVKLHAALGSRWSLIAAQLPGRTDNDVKNYWNTRLKKKLCEIGIDPITHKPISQLLADLAGNIALPKGGQIAEAALGCFKDGMLNVLMRTRPDWQNQQDCDTAILSNNNLGLSWEVGGCSNMTFGAKPVGLAEMDVGVVDPALLKMRQGMALHKMPMNINCSSMNMNLPPQTGASKHNIMYPNQQINDSRPILDVNYMNTSTSKPSISYGRDALTFNPSMHWTPEPLASLDPAEIASSISHFPPAEEVASRSHEPINKNQQNGALQFAWSPSGSAGSTCSSASVADAATFDRVMNSDVLLWDFSDV